MNKKCRSRPKNCMKISPPQIQTTEAGLYEHHQLNHTVNLRHENTQQCVNKYLDEIGKK